jgi:peptidoglycan/LPS O-acetylase OafA/YrhL
MSRKRLDLRNGQSSPPPPTQRVLELDGLRAFAILLVMGCHYPGFARLLGGLPELGWMGVDFFFALSGFLITRILLGSRNQPKPYATFYARRAVRILPPYLCVVAVIIGFAFAEHWTDRWGVSLRSLFFLGALNPLYQPFAAASLHHPFPPLLGNAHHLPFEACGVQMAMASAPAVFWSLSIEEYFYLLWAPVVLQLSRRAIAWTGAAVCLLEILLRWLDHSQFSYYGLGFRADALLAGAFVALLFDHWRRSAVPKRAVALFQAGCLFSALAWASVLFAIRPVLARNVRASTLVQVFGLPIISIGAASLIGLLQLRAGQPWWLGKILRWRPFQFLGAISYTMYLVHVPAIVLADRLSAGHRHWPVALLGTAITIAIAYASGRWLEMPLLAWKDRRFPNAPHPRPSGVSGI